MTPSRFQFTIRSILWMTCGVAMVCAGLGYGPIGPPMPSVWQGVALCALFFAPLPTLFSVCLAVGFLLIALAFFAIVVVTSH